MDSRDHKQGEKPTDPLSTTRRDIGGIEVTFQWSRRVDPVAARRLGELLFGEAIRETLESGES